MTTVHHKYFVSLEMAKLLKDAGFDWEINSCYNCYGIPTLSTDKGVYKNYNEDENIISAPTLDVTQRWLREMTTWQVEAICVYKEHKKLYSYCVFHDEYKDQILEEDFKTYEDALEAGIKKALEMILEKG